MNTMNEKLVAWAVEKIRTQYKNDVALLIDSGVEKPENDSQSTPFACSRVGFDYFVPINELGRNLGKTFIVDGIGYDLYPRSWERLDSMANLEDYNTCVLGEAKILYARSEADRERFEAVRQKLFANLKDPAFCYKKALEKLAVAMEIYQTMMFSDALHEVRMSAGFIADYLAQSIALANGRYFKYSQTRQLEEMAAFAGVPERFTDYYRLITRASTIGELKNLSYLVILTTRQFLGERKPAPTPAAPPDFRNLADWYQELSYTWRRIYHRCWIGDVDQSFVWGCMLQHELNIIREEFGLKEMDLMGAFQADDLSALKARAQEHEKYIVEKITENGVQIETYATVDEFLQKNG